MSPRYNEMKLMKRMAVASFVFLGLVALLPACGGLGAARDAYKEGDLPKADRLVSEVVEEEPENAAAWALRADVARSQGEVNEAVTYGERAVSLAPGVPAIHHSLALAYIEANQLPPVCDTLDTMDQLAPGSADKVVGAETVELLGRAGSAAKNSGQDWRALICYDMLAERDQARFEADFVKAYEEAATGYAALLVASGRYEDAASLYAELDERVLSSQRAYLLPQGELLLSLGREEEAVTSFEAYFAATTGPAAAERAAKIGQVYHQREAFQAAADWLERAVALEPAKRWRAIELIELRLKLKEVEAARQTMDLLLGESLEATDYLMLNEALLRAGWSEWGEQALLAGQLAHPGDWSIVEALADHYYLAGTIGKAEVLFTAYLDGQQDTGVGAAAAGWWLLEHGADNAARDYFERAAAGAEPPQELYLSLAKAQAKQLDYGAMEDSLRVHIERMGSLDARRDAASLALETRHYDFVVDVLTPAFDEDPSDMSTAGLLLDAYYGLNQLADEEAIYRRWAEAQPEPAAAFLVVGDHYAARGDDGRAMTYYQRSLDDPNYAQEARYLLALFEAARGDEVKAAAWQQQYVAASEDGLNARLRFFDAYRAAKRNALAIALGREISSEHPSFALVNLQLASLYFQADDRDEALVFLKLYIERAESPAVGARSAVTEAGRWDEIGLAVEAIEYQLEAHPEWGELRVALGDALWAQSGRVDLADAKLKARLLERAEAAYASYLDLPNLSEEDAIRFAMDMSLRRLHALALAAFERSGAALDSARGSIRLWLRASWSWVRTRRPRRRWRPLSKHLQMRQRLALTPWGSLFVTTRELLPSISLFQCWTIPREA